MRLVRLVMSRWRHNGIPGIIDIESMSTARLINVTKNIKHLRKQNYPKVILRSITQMLHCQWQGPCPIEVSDSYIFFERTTHDPSSDENYKNFTRSPVHDICSENQYHCHDIEFRIRNDDWKVSSQSDIPIPTTVKTWDDT